MSFEVEVTWSIIMTRHIKIRDKRVIFQKWLLSSATAANFIDVFSEKHDVFSWDQEPSKQVVEVSSLINVL